MFLDSNRCAKQAHRPTLGLMNPVPHAEEQHGASQFIISAPPVKRIIYQDHQLTYCQANKVQRGH